MQKDESKKKNTHLLRIKDLIDQAAEESGLDKDLAFELTEDYFQRIKNLLEDHRRPKIYLPEFGKFSSSVGKVKKYIDRRINSFKTGKYPKHLLQRSIKQFWFVYDRLRTERHWDKHGKPLADRYNNFNQEEFEAYFFENIKSELPEDYFDLVGIDFINFLDQEPRFFYKIKKTFRNMTEWNSLLGHWDYGEFGIPPCGKFSEEEKSLYKKRGRKPRDLEERAAIVNEFFEQIEELRKFKKYDY